MVTARGGSREGAGAFSGVGEGVDLDEAVEKYASIGSGAAGVAVSVVTDSAWEVFVFDVLEVQVFVPAAIFPCRE